METLVTTTKNPDGSIDATYSQTIIKKFQEAELLAEKQILEDKLKEINDLLA